MSTNEPINPDALTPTPCSSCDGTGQKKGSNDHEWETFLEACEVCEGSGEIPSIDVTPIEPTEPCRCTTSPPLAEPLCSASLDVADCCTSLEEARDVIRRREKYANGLMAWMMERRNAPDATTLEMIQERLRPLCSIPNSKSPPP